MKRLLVCLLLVGVVGCGSSPSPEPPVAQDDKPAPPLVETDADKAEAEYNRGVRFTDRKAWVFAIVCYTEAIRINPDFAKAYNKRAWAYRQLDEYDKALTDYTEVIRINPNDVDAYVHR